jgi:hypothetical protein
MYVVPAGSHSRLRTGNVVQGGFNPLRATLLAALTLVHRSLFPSRDIPLVAAAHAAVVLYPGGHRHQHVRTILAPCEPRLPTEETEPMQLPIAQVEWVLGPGIGVHAVAHRALRQMLVDLPLITIPVDRGPTLTAVPPRAIAALRGVGGHLGRGLVEGRHMVADELFIRLGPLTSAQVLQDLPEAGLMRP